MPEIQIRPAVGSDLPVLVEIDHSYSSDIVWQMEIAEDERQVGVMFRQTRLPRSVQVEYPRLPSRLLHDPGFDDGAAPTSTLLVAVMGELPVGYVNLHQEIAPLTTWATDLVVVRRLRRQGIGRGLALAAQEWARARGSLRLVLEMQPKNYPAICLARKLGFDFCGYNDRYYANHDIALFFTRPVR